MKNKRSGFLLMELVIAFLVFGIISTLFMNITRKKNDLLVSVKYRTIALQAAESKLEEIRAEKWEKILSLNSTSFPVEGLKAKDKNLAGKIEVESLSPKALKIKIQVTWYLNSDSAPTIYSLVSWLGEGGLFYEKK